MVIQGQTRLARGSGNVAGPAPGWNGRRRSSSPCSSCPPGVTRSPAGADGHSHIGGNTVLNGCLAVQYAIRAQLTGIPYAASPGDDSPDPTPMERVYGTLSQLVQGGKTPECSESVRGTQLRTHRRAAGGLQRS